MEYRLLSISKAPRETWEVKDTAEFPHLKAFVRGCGETFLVDEEDDYWIGLEPYKKALAEIDALREVVKRLWGVRDYGIPEVELWEKASAVLPEDMLGQRPVDERGLSIKPRAVL